MERATFGTQDLVQPIFTNPDYLHNKENITEILQGTGLTAECLENDPEAIRNKKLTTLDNADIAKAYARSQVQYD